MLKAMNENENESSSEVATNVIKTKLSNVGATSSSANINVNKVDNEAKQTSMQKLFRRFNSFINFYFLKNKIQFVFSILSYVFDLLLFISLNLYLLLNNSLLTRKEVMPRQNNEENSINTITRTTVTTTTSENNLLNKTTTTVVMQAISNNQTIEFLNKSSSFITLKRRSIGSSLEIDEPKYELKQSYLTLEIIAVFIFFIYFILNNLIKLQLKYHRLAIRKNKYGYSNSSSSNNENENEDDEDEEDIKNEKLNNYSFTTSFSSSHYSSSANSTRASRLKRIIKIILSKFSSNLLYFFYGYQYCQNTFLTDITTSNKTTNETMKNDFDSFVGNAMYVNDVKMNILLTVFIVISTISRVIVYYLKSYFLIDHQQKKRSIITNDYNHLLLFLGYNLAFFHVFNINIAFKLSFTLFLILITKHLLDYKQYKSVIFEVGLLLYCLNSYFHGYLSTSFNSILFICFLITFFYKAIVINASSCSCCKSSIPITSSITSLDILNKKFLCKNLKFHKFSILITLIFKLILLVIIILVLIAKYRTYYFSLIIILPIAVILSIIWILFNLLNVINLWLLMNKISECYKIAIDQTRTSSQLEPDEQVDEDENTLEKHENSREASTPVTKPSFRTYLIKLFKSKLPVKLKVLNRIMAYKGIRYLATVSYYIGVICFIQTLLFIIFVTNINSIVILNLFLIIISINLFWLNLMHELSSIISGTSIIYALVAPIDDSSSNRLSFLTSPVNSAINGLNVGAPSVPTYQNTYYQPSGYKKENLNKRSMYLLNKLYKFISNHLIENFGCDYLTSSFSRVSIESKLKSFFSKSTLDGPKYNTYILYYCGPSLKTLSNQQQVCNLLLQDGTQLSIDDIINIWKETHCTTQQQSLKVQPHKRSKDSIRYKNMPSKADTTDSDDQGYNETISSQPNGTNNTVLTLSTSKNSSSSRLILIIDAENTDLLLKYVNKKLTQRNLFVALQTAVYFTPENTISRKKKQDNKNKKDSIRLSSNVGRFTIDLINYSFKANHLLDHSSKLANGIHSALDEDDDDEYSDYENIFSGGDQQYEQNNDDSDDASFNKSINLHEMQTLKKHKNHLMEKTNLKLNKYYECKYALSRYWPTYKFESSDLQEEMKQFWKLYYPKCLQPMLKLINLSLFSMKFNCLKKCDMFFRQIKYKILPLPKEYDTGHGFNLISS